MRGARKAVAALAVAAVAAACCVGVSVAAPTKQAQDKGTIKIGQIATTGGTYANFPGAVAVSKATTRYYNAHGGLNGYKIELDYCNDKNDPNVGAACARKLVQDGVVALIGGGTIGAAGTVVPILNKAKIPMIGWNPATGPEFNSPNIYLFSSGSLIGYNILIPWAAHKGLPMSIVSADNTVARALIPGLEATAKASKGSIVNKTFVSATQADYAPLVQASQEGNPKAAIMFTGQEQGALFIKAAEAAGAGFQQYFELGIYPSFIKQIGAAGPHVLTTSAFPPFNSSNPLIAKFRTAMAAEKAAGDGDADLSKLNDIDFNSWLAMYVLGLVTKNMKDITGPNVMAALNKAKDLNLQGVIPPWTPNKAGPKGLARVSNEPQYIIGFKANAEPYLVTKQPITIAQSIAGKF
jgi:ABC-type branched-subunit amino acid transport system substrate-binding protein